MLPWVTVFGFLGFELMYLDYVDSKRYWQFSFNARLFKHRLYFGLGKEIPHESERTD